MQQSIDNRAAAAENLVLLLEGLGYSFGVVRGRLICAREIRETVKPYRKEIIEYLPRRGISYARRCKQIAGGDR